MASYELSGPADRDLTEIYDYSFREFGEATADTYLLGLLERFMQLAVRPEMGRRIDALRTGYFRFEFKRHVVFYVKIENGVRIMRVLHARMDPKRHV
jgi:toxin ParE1/3/4